MKLTAADRNVVSIIGQAFPPAPNGDPPPAMEWEPVIARAERQMLTPLLFDTLKKTDRLRELPPPVLLDLRTNYLRSANRSEENFRELAALLDALGEAQIPVILLKGAALAIALYDRIAQRPMCDLDLLLPKAALPVFLNILIGRGFVEKGNLGEGFEQEFMSEVCFARPDASRLTIEPHWHVLDTPYYAEKIPIEWFWAHTEPIVVRGRGARMLSPTAALLHLAAHYYVHHTGVGLLPLYDVARLLTRWSNRIDGEELTETARSFGLLWAVQAVLREVTALWEVPLPDRFSIETDTAGVSLPAEMAPPSRYLHHIQDLMGVVSLKARVVYLWKLLFPGKAYLRQRYGMRDDRLAVFYFGYRGIRCLAGIPGVLLLWMRWRSVSRKRRE